MNLVEKKKQFNTILFRWHKLHYRDMPWRNTQNPYRILVSEIMLQQTQVERVQPKYALFLKNFPTVHVLAKASLGDVLRVWSGLGYNRRAKYLHECAKRVALLHQGRIPNDIHMLLTLPGIGISTSAALSAFAFGRDEPMIDTNIRRILTRTFFSKKMPRSDLDLVVPKDRELYEFAKSLIPRGKGREWNYAMLDLGATLCIARNHKTECPMEKLHGKVGDFVYKKPQKKFNDSDRYYRGRIVSILVKGPTKKAVLQKLLSLPLTRLNVILGDLSEEKLIIRQGMTLRLP